MSSIFISIASYCDPLLIHTIQDAIQKAEKPENLHFGVVEQQVHEKRLTLANETARQMVRYIGVAPEESRGVCWARSLANTLYEGEEFFLQIDAHMLFEKDWDTQLIRQLDICQRTNPKSLLTCYPNHFEWVDGIPTAKPVTQKVLAHVLKEPAALEADNPTLLFQAVPVEVDHPVQGFHLAGGCLFGPGRFLSEVPYDPRLYFHGEEQALAVRAFTHGWDIWHPCALPIYHFYDLEPQANKREKHWSASSNEKRFRKYWEFEEASKKRLIALLYNHEDLGIYGLGHARSLAEYAAFSGIDYEKRSLGDRARSGPWSFPVTIPSTKPQGKDMNKIMIDNKEYELDRLSPQAKADLEMLLATDQKILELQKELAIAQTARQAYAASLQTKLPA